MTRRVQHLKTQVAKLQRCAFSLRGRRLRILVFLNAAAVGYTALKPRVLLDALLAIEQERGRERPYLNAPRTLDLDLILAGDTVVKEPGLVLPHPRFRERRFVLEPLAAVAPELRDPVSGRTVAELLSDVAAGSAGA